MVIIIILTCISIPFLIDNVNLNYYNTKNILNPNAKITTKNQFDVLYKASNVINITSNNDMVTRAKNNGWIGSGTQNNPIIIQHLLFNGTEFLNGSIVPDLIISNVTLYYVIQNNNFTDTSGIFLNNTSNGKINDNIFQNLNYPGTFINIWSSTNIIIQNNKFTLKNREESYVFNIYDSNKILFKENLMDGIWVNNQLSYSNCVGKVQTSNETNFFNNSIRNCQLLFGGIINANFTNNFFMNSPIFNSYCSTILSYNIIENSYTFPALIIKFDISDIIGQRAFNMNNVILTYGITIDHNLFNNNSIGIKFYSNTLHSSDATVKQNEFINNTAYAIYISNYNYNNSIYRNDFISNNESVNNDPKYD